MVSLCLRGGISPRIDSPAFYNGPVLDFEIVEIAKVVDGRGFMLQYLLARILLLRPCLLMLQHTVTTTLLRPCIWSLLLSLVRCRANAVAALGDSVSSDSGD